ncbi:C-C motif chemokine 3-like [Archocentrus centrarchus]|uniref:C-C motif chemokine 3-like n=1 Tax=Archocentrus centrarchus TaxID=63155 RepID=UPI0011EA2C8D|nr:C-C motif chemokine 3-like [Archocentrus centrarchus]XP_030588018.1 C-C motif chemokine 3-like [Archocentrus centrarchus]
MKTTVGLLLLMLPVYYCTNNNQGVNVSSPGECCFKFFTGRIPAKNVVSVTKTHSGCLEKAFVIRTAAGRRVCVSQNVTWAQKAFKQQQINAE